MGHGVGIGARARRVQVGIATVVACGLAFAQASQAEVIHEHDDMEMERATGVGTTMLRDAVSGEPFCEGDGVSGSRIQAVYGHVAGTPDNYATSVDEITSAAGAIDDAYDLSADRQGGSAHPRWAFEPGTCEFSVLKVELPAGAPDDFSLTRAALADLGLRARTDRKYVVWVDAEGTDNLIATAPFDDTPNPATNQADGGASIAAVAQLTRNSGWDTDGFNAGTLRWGPQHEVSHMLGAVNFSAPHANSGHCTDNHDAMCFGDTVVAGCTSFPADKLLLDCNGDDYFAVDPPTGSYLDTHWNTYESSFLVRSDTSDTPPVTSITSGPSGTVAAGTASFGFASSDPGSTFECSLDGGEFEPCPATHEVSGLGDGAHMLQARAVDPAGNRDWTPAERAWTVDLPDPVEPDPVQTKIQKVKMKHKRRVAVARFRAFDGTGKVTFKCKVDRKKWRPCRSPKRIKRLKKGRHVLKVRAFDDNGRDRTPAVKRFRVRRR